MRWLVASAASRLAAGPLLSVPGTLPGAAVVGGVAAGGVLGAALVVAAQSKAQVINTYSSSMSLTNIFDSLFRWRPGRVAFVVVANLLSLALLGGELLRLREQPFRLHRRLDAVEDDADAGRQLL